MQKININEAQTYDVLIGSNIFYNQLKKQFVNYKQIVFFIDDKVKVPNDLQKCGKIEYLKVSEKIKSTENFTNIIEFLSNNNIDRKDSLIVAIGGGVTLDLIGFCASVYKRGVDLIYVPTTLLAMVDVAVGSKNTINMAGIKNLVGSFYSPKAVIMDLEFLTTLDKRNFNNGIAEVIKHGCIHDESILTMLEREEIDIKELVIKSVKVKKHFIELDSKDKGIRQVLNFGHTYGHAIEAYYDFEKYLHGEAISIGMNLVYDNKRLKTICKKYQLPVSIDEAVISELLPYMKNDKKNSGNEIKFVTLKKLGEVKWM